MKKHGTRTILILLGSAAMSVGCSTAPSTSTTGTGGTTGGGGSMGTGTNVPLMPDMTGWVDKTTNTLGIQGAWYAYGDATDCAAAGHAASECSVITSPAMGSFPNTGGSMCTKGTAAKVLNTAAGAADYSGMWGAGIGIDLNNSGGGATAVKSPYNATMNGVIGFSFTIDHVPLSADGIRVEIPTPTTATTAHFKTLPSSAMGAQTVLFADMAQGSWVTAPTMLDKTMLLSVQFHVPTNTGAAVPYEFCISNFAAVK